MFLHLRSPRLNVIMHLVRTTPHRHSRSSWLPVDTLACRLQAAFALLCWLLLPGVLGDAGCVFLALVLIESNVIAVFFVDSSRVSSLHVWSSPIISLSFLKNFIT